ncbi:MAG: hypothetical protein AAB069_07635 [Planctomycetota bacterium]
MRKSFDAEFMSKVSLDAIREEKTLAWILKSIGDTGMMVVTR